MAATLFANAEVFHGMPAGDDLSTSSLEHSVIKKAILRPYLQAMGADPMGYAPLPPEDPALHQPLPGGKMKLLTILLTSGYRGGVWMLKSSRLILMWPALHKEFPNALWVVVRRDAEEVVRSCTATGSGAPDGMDWRGWVASYERRFLQLAENGANVIELWPSDFFKGEYDGAREALRLCGRAGWAGESIGWLDERLRARQNGRR
jgi:hypothetical protein